MKVTYEKRVSDNDLIMTLAFVRFFTGIDNVEVHLNQLLNGTKYWIYKGGSHIAIHHNKFGSYDKGDRLVLITD